MNANTAKIKDLNRLPPLPQAALLLYEKLQSPTSSLSDVTKILSTDAALSAKVLKLANSGYYLIPGGVRDVKKALEFLGFNTIAQIVLTSSVTHLFRGTPKHSHFLSLFWAGSLATAVAAEIAIKRKNPKLAAEAFTAGLLSDLGKLVYLELEPENLDQILENANHQQLDFDESAIQLSKTTARDFRVELLQHWKLPKELWSNEPSDIHQAAVFGQFFARWKKLAKAGDHRLITEEHVKQSGSIFGISSLEVFTEAFTLQFEKARTFMNG